MRILHTADWHLGKKLGRIDRADDLKRSVEAIFGYCETHAVDLLLIAGDLFDSVCRQDDVCAAIDHLKEAARPFLRGGGTILATTGNHDGETFCKTLQHTLALADPVTPRPGDPLAPGRFHLMTRPAFHRLADRSGQEVQFVLMPYPTASRYLDDSVTPYQGGPEGKNRRLRQTFTETLGRMRGHPAFDPRLHTVLAAHLFLQGAILPNGYTITSEDERTDIVCPGEDLGAGWAYVALGHVHKPQTLGGQSSVRYSGSIERLDFGERDDEKGAVLFEIGSEGLHGEPLWLPLNATPFLEVNISDPALELPELEAKYPLATNALVRCHVTYRPDEHDPDEIHRRLDSIFPRCYARTVVPRGLEPSAGDETPWSGPSNRSVREVVLDYVQAKLGNNPDAEAVLAEAEALFQEVGL